MEQTASASKASNPTTSSEPLEVLVLGGGITGLCIGTLLQENPRFTGRFRVLEAASEPGGTARTDCSDGYVCDWGPNGFLDKEPRTLDWVHLLGLDDALQRANKLAARRFIYRGGKLHEIKPPPAFLLSPLMSLRGRMRLLCEPFIAPRNSHAPETVRDFAARRIGREAADVLVTPMVSGVFGGNADALEMEACFPRLVEMEQRYGSLFKALRTIKREDPKASPMGPKGVLTTFEGGLGRVVDTAAQRLGDHLYFNATARKLHHENGVYHVETADGATHHAKQIVVALPAHAAAQLLQDLTPQAATALSEIPYAGMVVVCTGYPKNAVEHDLHGFGFLVPRIEKKRMLGCIWTHSLFPGSAPEGKVLLRTMLGGATDPEALQLDDAALLDILKEELHPILGIKQAPSFVRIFRHTYGIPQYTLGHAERREQIARAEKLQPGLYFAGNAYQGISLNDCVVSAYEVVDKLRMI